MSDCIKAKCLSGITKILLLCLYSVKKYANLHTKNHFIIHKFAQLKKIL